MSTTKSQPARQLSHSYVAYTLPMEKVAILRLRDMLARQQGSLIRRVLHIIFSIALRLFFRRIETAGAGLVPRDGPLIFVLNHPNGLIDPALVFCSLPRRISFLAKSTLFRLPVISFILRAAEALPLYRRIDQGEDQSLNRLTFAVCHELLQRGGCIALFPEGVSHNETQLLPVKTGAARIALGALAAFDDEPPDERLSSLRIVPVGLYYTSKTSFRSEALLRFGEPFAVTPVSIDERGEPLHEDVRQLSMRIDAALRRVTLNVENTETLETVAKAEQLFSSIYETINFRHTLSEEFNLRRRVAASLAQLDAAPSASLHARIQQYEAELAGLGIKPENLSVLAHSRWFVFRHFLLKGGLLLLLSPLTIAGAIIHLPAYLLCVLFSRLFRRHGPDEIESTVKILLAMLLMPLTWLILSGWLWWSWNWRVALVSLPSIILCGYVALRALEELSDMRGWLKAGLIFLQRQHSFLRLLLERRALHGEIKRYLDSARR
ncbi:MAG: lysophospholipid acyltransferase family protein [Acidobacteriota bacterium]|nr:lysophospholipid acyltransferase family protein [Acidobacteriota bacterium]